MSIKPAQSLRRLPQVLLIALIRGYQLMLSPLLGASCRFQPSCSQYAIDAIRTHGSGKGVMLASGRLLRCNPCCAGGHDPVPEQFSLLKKLML